MDEVNQDQLKPEANDNPEIWKTWTTREFLSYMLHELRNPVMVIKGYSALLSNEEAKEHHPKAIEAISRNAKILELLLKDMSNYYGYIKEKSDPEP